MWSKTMKISQKPKDIFKNVFEMPEVYSTTETEGYTTILLIYNCVTYVEQAVYSTAAIRCHKEEKFLCVIRWSKEQTVNIALIN